MLLQAKELLLNTKGAKEQYEKMVEGTLNILQNKGVEITKEIEQDTRERVMKILYYTAVAAVAQEV